MKKCDCCWKKIWWTYFLHISKKINICFECWNQTFWELKQSKKFLNEFILEFEWNDYDLFSEFEELFRQITWEISIEILSEVDEIEKQNPWITTQELFYKLKENTKDFISYIKNVDDEMTKNKDSIYYKVWPSE